MIARLRAIECADAFNRYYNRKPLECSAT